MNYQEENALNLLEFRSGNVSLWEDQSRMLKAAADIIYPNLVDLNQRIIEDHAGLYYPTAGLNQMWMLSVGYSIECLLKTIIIVTTDQPIIIGNKFNMKIFGSESKSHDLFSLLKKIYHDVYKNIFTPEQNSFLNKMTVYIIWRGKYPVPKDPRDLIWYLGPDNEKLSIDLDAAKLTGDKDKKSFEQIFDLLSAKLAEVKKSKF